MGGRAGMRVAVLAAWLNVCAAVVALHAHAADDSALLSILVASYPEFLAGHEGNELVWKDGTRMPFDDGKRDKDFETLLASPSLRDMYTMPYVTRKTAPPGLNFDPGRVRNEAFFLKMYGDCRKGGLKPLAGVVWLPKKWGKTIKVTSVNGVAAALQRVSDELDELPASFAPYLFPPAGTVNCRTIAGTNRLSAHGTGTAIDIATRHSNYWQWEKPSGAGLYIWRNQIPAEIVDIFERHGFIWGGKWYHYDTMHFEYRPDLIAAGNLP
jgi:hypothetical protein